MPKLLPTSDNESSPERLTAVVNVEEFLRLLGDLAAKIHNVLANGPSPDDDLFGNDAAGFDCDLCEIADLINAGRR